MFLKLRSELLRDLNRFQSLAVANNAADSLHRPASYCAVAVFECYVHGQRLHADPLNRQSHGEDIFILRWRFKAAGRGDAGPADCGAVRQMFDDGKAKRPEKFVFRLLHPAIEVGEVDDARHVGFAELHAASHLERRSH